MPSKWRSTLNAERHRKKRTIMLTDEELAALDDYVQARGTNRGLQVVEWLDESLEAKTRYCPPEFDRLTMDPAILNGQLCIRGTRLSVQRVASVLAVYGSLAEIFEDYPGLTVEDIRQVVDFALIDPAIRRELYPT